jgi:hypothetical protein
MPIPRKPAASIIAIDSARSGGDNSSPPPPTPAKGAESGAHRFTRRSFVAMFLVGRGVRRIARFHRVPEELVERELRANLVPTAEIRRRYDLEAAA